MVDNTGDILDINSALCQISGHQEGILALFEASKACLTPILQQRYTK